MDFRNEEQMAFKKLLQIALRMYDELVPGSPNKEPSIGSPWILSLTVKKVRQDIIGEMELSTYLWCDAACIAPPKSGPAYYNYKRFYSIVIMALVDW